MGPQKTPIEKTWEINVETDSINIDILGANLNCLLSMIKAINIPQYMTVIMSNRSQKK